jgi:hypothetical protein
LYAVSQVTKYTSLDTTVALPSGYEDMIVTNLAVRCAPTWETAVHQDLRDAAAASKTVVKRTNRRSSLLKFEAGALVNNPGLYDIKTDV